MQNSISFTLRVSEKGVAPDPLALHRYGPPFSFSEEEEKAIAEVVGRDKVVRVCIVADNFLDRREYYNSLNSKEETQKLFEIEEKAEELLKLLDNPVTRNHILGWASLLFNDEYAQIVAATNKIFPPPPLPVVEKLKEVSSICRAVRQVYKPGKRGRKIGTGDKAAYQLVEGLYPICFEVNRGFLTTKPGNVLERLIAALEKPLELGGTLPGITRKVIEEFAKQKKKPSG